MGRRDPAHDHRRERGDAQAEGEGRADARTANLGREYLSGIAKPGAEAAGDEEVCRQSHPEQARGAIDMAHHDEETAGWDREGRDHPTPTEHVAQPAADPIGEDGAEHPDREIAAHGLEAELLFGSEIEWHPGRPAEPGEEIEEVDERGD